MSRLARRHVHRRDTLESAWNCHDKQDTVWQLSETTSDADVVMSSKILAGLENQILFGPIYVHICI